MSVNSTFYQLLGQYTGGNNMQAFKPDPGFEKLGLDLINKNISNYFTCVVSIYKYIRKNEADQYSVQFRVEKDNKRIISSIVIDADHPEGRVEQYDEENDACNIDPLVVELLKLLTIQLLQSKLYL